VIKSISNDPSVIGEDGVYRHTGVAKVFTSEKAAIKAIKTRGIEAGDIIVVIGCGTSGTGMEEIYQLTSALKYLHFGKHVSLITDARFSGVSTGACIGHVGPEALDNGQIGKLHDDDLIEIVVDCLNMVGSVHFVETENNRVSLEEATKLLEACSPHPDLSDDTCLWLHSNLQVVVLGAEVCMIQTE